MEFLLGIRGRDYVLLASDLLSIRSIMILTSEASKFTMLSPSLLLSCIGESGEADRLKETIIAESNIAALKMNGHPWSPSEAAHFCRSLIAKSLRTRSPYGVNLLMGGVNGSSGGELYWIDHLGSIQPLPFAAHGYGAYFCMGLLDSQYSPDMSSDEAIKMVMAVINELQTRFVVQMPKLELRLVDASGTRTVSVDNWRVSPSEMTWRLADLARSAAHPRTRMEIDNP